MKTFASSDPKYPVDTIFRAASLLEALGESKQEMGIKALSEAVGLSASTTHRLLDTLVSIGYVQRNPTTRQYKLGIGLFQIGMRVLSQYGMNPDVRLTLEELAEKTGETAKLGARFNDKMVYLGIVESSNPLRFTGHVGSWGPLYCTAMGKMMLSTLSKQEQAETIDRMLPLKSYTPKTIVEKTKLLEQLDQICDQGYAVDDEEFLIGSRGLACPIYNQNRQMVTSISISGPSARLSLTNLLSFLQHVQAAAERLSEVTIF